MVAASTSSAVVEQSRPEIHIWMSSDEAAATLGASEQSIRRKIDQGDLEMRVADDGSRQVLVALPQRQRQRIQVHRRPRPDVSSQAAWGVVVVLMLAASGAGAIVTRAMIAAREQLKGMSSRMDRMSDTADAWAAERDRLHREVVDARQAAARAEGELAVERKVEDTLITAALAARGTQTTSAVAATGSE